jgi:glycogen synthase kinase 3 beta
MSKTKHRIPKLKIIKELGRGCFGVVFHAILQGDPNIDIAWKRMHKNSNNQSREFEMLSLVKGKTHCVQLIDFFYSRNSFQDESENLIQNFILELCSGNLESLLKLKQKKILNLPYLEIKKIIYQTLLGVKDLHDVNICHRDLKPENIFYNRNVIKIGDLGSSKQLKTFDKNTPYIVSRYYRAPELIIGIKTYSHNVDIFSVGVILYELVTCHLPFKGKSEGYQFIEIFRNLGPPSKETQELYRILIGWNGEFKFNLEKNSKSKKKSPTLSKRNGHVQTVPRVSKGKFLKRAKKSNKIKKKEQIFKKGELDNPKYKKEFLKCKESILKKTEISPFWDDDYELLFKIKPHLNCFEKLKSCDTEIDDMVILIE